MGGGGAVAGAYGGGSALAVGGVVAGTYVVAVPRWVVVLVAWGVGLGCPHAQLCLVCVVWWRQGSQAGGGSVCAAVCSVCLRLVILAGMRAQ